MATKTAGSDGLALRRMEWVTFNWFDFGPGNGDWLKPNDWFYSSIYPKYTHTHAHYRYIFGCNAATKWTRCRRLCLCWVTWIICLLSIDRLFQWNHITPKTTAAAAAKGARTHTHKQTHFIMQNYYAIEWIAMNLYVQFGLRRCFAIVQLLLSVRGCECVSIQHFCVYLFVRLFKDVRCTRLYVYYIYVLWVCVCVNICTSECVRL